MAHDRRVSRDVRGRVAAVVRMQERGPTKQLGENEQVGKELVQWTKLELVKQTTWARA